ncbi:5-oxoprolinase subunit PxpB [Vibrio sp. E150_011]
MNRSLTIQPASESSLIVYFGAEIDPELPVLIAEYARQIKQHYAPYILNCIPSYTSLTIEYHPLKLDDAELRRFISAIKPMRQDSNRLQKTIQLPIYYDTSVGPDLINMAAQLSLSTHDIIACHQSTIYTVCAIGFAPGFAFLADVDPLIRMPRLTEPRKFVPKGSVGIADRQTAVYPMSTPGGWNIIGNCPVSLYDAASPQHSLLQVGDRVQFHAIHQDEFIALGGELCPHW